MTRSQVRYLLGTPMVPDAFDKDRWDYLYYLKKGRLHAPEQRHLIVYFQDDKVARFDNTDVGPMPPAEQRPVEPKSEARSAS
jgi:outer membrane protein assembly factor BamE